MHPCVHAVERPRHPALIRADSGLVMTYEELEAASNRFAQLLRARAIAPGDHIALLLENHPRYHEILWGAQRCGVIYTAISSRLTPEEAAYIVNDSGARLVVSSKAMSTCAKDLPSSCPNVQTWLMIGASSPGWWPYEDTVGAMPAQRVADETAGVDMLYSSGTTGRPKGVYSPPVDPRIDFVPPSTQQTMHVYGFDERTVYLSPAPLYHAAPLRFNMLVQRAGGTCVVMEHFDPEEFLGHVQKYRVTHTQMVPTMFVRMLKLPEHVRRRYDVSSLRCAVHAAAPCPIEIKEQMIEWWGPVLWEYYAGTEGNGVTIVDTPQWLTHKGTVGRPLAGSVKICNESGEELSPGEEGIVYFAGGRSFEYHNDPEKTAQSRHPKGWTTLGDVGRLDEEGYLYLTDRKAFMIISGGVNIYPQEAENVLVLHPKVMDVAVFGVPDEEFGEQVKAVVQLRDPAKASPALAAELIEYCRSHLAHYKCPRSIDFEAELPRHPTGKLYKRLLRDRYWAGRSSRIV
jgi:long-chain acyl-CoA synthetase